MKRMMIVPVLLALLSGSAIGEKIKVGVAGDSIASNPPAEGAKPWPEVLKDKLGAEYEVTTFAANGLSVLTNTYRSLWTRAELGHALAYKPNIALIAYGASDAKPGNWARKREVIGNYKKIINQFKALPTKPKIYICLPPPATKDSPYGIDKKILHEELIPTLKQIAQETGVEVIDTHTPLVGRPDATVNDGLYPSAVGCQLMGLAVYQALTGKAVEMPAAPKGPTKEEIAAEEAKLAVKAPHVKMLNVGDTAELTPEYVANPKGDGPDGAGNTEDDTWQFWFELAHAMNTYHRLALATATMPEDQRLNGIFDPKSKAGHQKKVTGPIAGSLPNPKDSEGWIFYTDWDGRYEGFWGDRKANQVLTSPFVEKNSHCAVAVTFRVPADGAYDISGKLTDLQVIKAPKHDGIRWHMEVVRERTGAESPKANREVGSGGPVGDKVGPDSAEFAYPNVELKKGELLRLVISPGNWWGTDLTKVEGFKIKRVK